MDNRRKQTLRTWDKLADLYQEKFMFLTLYDESYDDFLARLIKKDSSILEIGCGPGNISRYLLNKNTALQIDGIDSSPNMVALAKKNNPSACYEIMDSKDVGNIKKSYDGIVCGFCLPYLSKKELSDLLKSSNQLLHEHGILYLSTIEGNYANSDYQTGSTGDKIYVYYYESDFLKSQLRKFQFELLREFRISYTKSNGKEENHLILIAKRDDHSS